MSGLVQRAGIAASADVLEDGTVVVRLKSDELRDEVAAFVRRSGRGATRAAWTSAMALPDTRPRAVLALELRADDDVFHLGLAMPPDFWMSAPRGPLTVAILLTEPLEDPADHATALANGIAVATPELVR